MALVGMNRDEVKAKKYANSAARVRLFRDHPAVLAWHTMDEPGVGIGKKDLKELAADAFMPGIYRVIKENDTRHPVTAVVCRFSDHQRFTLSMDVHQADYYPGLASKERAKKLSHLVSCFGFRSQRGKDNPGRYGRAGDCKNFRCTQRFGCEPRNGWRICGGK